MGLDVVADCVNPVSASRNGWRRTASRPFCLGVAVVAVGTRDGMRNGDALDPEARPSALRHPYSPGEIDGLEV